MPKVCAGNAGPWRANVQSSREKKIAPGVVAGRRKLCWERLGSTKYFGHAESHCRHAAALNCVIQAEDLRFVVAPALGLSVNLDLSLQDQNDPVLFDTRLGVERGAFAVQFRAGDGDFHDLLSRGGVGFDELGFV